MNATRFDGEVRIDGNLDQAIYQQVAPVTNFIQQIPNAGEPSSERTKAWIFFDDDNIHVAARVYEAVPESDWIADEMRRDTSQLRTNDSFSVMLDTYLDRRNGSAFLVPPFGGYSDFAITNEGDGGRGVNFDGNIVWDSRVGRFDGGWTVEMEIPFRSLRHEPGEEQIWGIQLRRISEAGTLENLRVPAQRFNLEVKPCGLGNVIANRESTPRINDEEDGEFGVDMKFGITNNLAADFTCNTDFAQVEVDERQVDLTRFSQFFPEKREFFPEGRGSFDLTQARGLEIPTMFLSRRIGDYEIGALTINTDVRDFSMLELSLALGVGAGRRTLRGLQ